MSGRHIWIQKGKLIVCLNCGHAQPKGLAPPCKGPSKGTMTVKR